MVIIKHKNGWSCSNDAYVDIHTEVVRNENGGIAGTRNIKVIKINGLYTVDGELWGIVDIAIKDTSTGEVIGMTGEVVDSNTIKVIDENCNVNWLRKI